MKLKALLFALVLFGLGACTQRTCPTYTMQDGENHKVNIETADVEQV
ncbi:hypothetical protein [Nafulsella turpanensis]|nr:hypothetical protein [Nafulsella turpanensis]